LKLIWAQARGGVIGNEGGMPWHVPEDLAHFKELTMGGTVVMGRKTWDALDPRFRPLPGRRNIVVTRDRSWSAEGAEAVHEIPDDGWIIGGAELFAATIDRAEALEVTELDIEVPGDTWAPPIGASWQAAEAGWQVSRTGVRYRFLSYSRVG
jgi:dihydrofolate reductase